MTSTSWPAYTSSTLVTFSPVSTMPWGELDFLYLELAQVEGLALGCSVLAGGDGVHYLARRITQGAIQSVDVLQSGNLKHRTRQALHLVHRLVNALRFLPQRRTPHQFC